MLGLSINLKLQHPHTPPPPTFVPELGGVGNLNQDTLVLKERVQIFRGKGL